MEASRHRISSVADYIKDILMSHSGVDPELTLYSIGRHLRVCTVFQVALSGQFRCRSKTIRIVRDISEPRNTVEDRDQPVLSWDCMRLVEFLSYEALS